MEKYFIILYIIENCCTEKVQNTFIGHTVDVG